MRSRMLRGTGYTGQSLHPGEEYEVDEKTGAIFVQLGKAQRVEAVEAREPEVEHRDPAPARTRGARER